MAQVLQNLSNALATTVKTTGYTVVRVAARRRLPAMGIVCFSDGVIVTAHHLVSEEENIHAGLPDGRTVPADLVGRDPTTDLAVLRAQATDLMSPAWADQESLQPT